MSDKPAAPAQSPYLTRQFRLVEALAAANVDALVLNPGPSLYYLTGLQFHLMERPVVAFFVPGSPLTIVLPELETAKLAKLPYPVQSFTYGDNPATWPAVFVKAVQATGIVSKAVGIEPGRLRVLEFNFLTRAAPTARFIPAEMSLAALRMCKDAEEVRLMRKAVMIAQQGLEATIPHLVTGASERELASELVLQMLRAGAEGEFAFTPIVSTGPNGANPHAFPSSRTLQPGDLLVIDWGAAYGGYVSDLTRTFAVGEVEPEFKLIANIVLEANAAGRAAGRPGVPAGDVDRAARAVIEKAGYGRYFTHRTGHGLGMEGHEDPYMFAENTLVLKPGMAFTVEPGIYLPDRGGVRIEDDVVVTETGAESLSDMPRELRVVG